jgi:hypothetical protein
LANDNGGDEFGVEWELATLGIVQLGPLNKGDPARANGGRGGWFAVGMGAKRAQGGGRVDRAIRWDAANAPVEFDAPANSDSNAIAANVLYDVVGTTGSQPGAKGAFWKYGAPMLAQCKWNRTDFSNNVTTETSAHMSINDSRIAVGQINDPAKGRRAATLWDLNAKNIADVDLNDLIDPKLGWVLTEANGINSNGIIVGTGTLNGNQRGYILVPKK